MWVILTISLFAQCDSRSMLISMIHESRAVLVSSVTHHKTYANAFADPVNETFRRANLSAFILHSSHRLYFTIQHVRRSHRHSIRKNVTNVSGPSPTGTMMNKLTLSSSCFLECVTTSTVTSMPISSRCFNVISSHCYRRKD